MENLMLQIESVPGKFFDIFCSGKFDSQLWGFQIPKEPFIFKISLYQCLF
jgi:hypothetical protein